MSTLTRLFFQYTFITFFLLSISNCGNKKKNNIIVEEPVDPPIVYTVTLRWTPPTENTDGSPVTLDHFVIYYGTSEYNLDNSIYVPLDQNPTLLENMPRGYTYYFAVTAVTDLGIESKLSNIVSKTI